MTRGMKGCYVYCADKETAEYLRSRICVGTKLLDLATTASKSTENGGF